MEQESNGRWLRPLIGLLLAFWALPLTAILGVAESGESRIPLSFAFAIGGALAGGLFGIPQVWGEAEKVLPMVRFVGLSAALAFILSLFIPGH
ncbi:MAG TPA: hypothetical protein PKY30_23540 [Myxococcota bacterium]|nr:hypothetical protein [Myxococcota bacterium]HNH50035.1 hypothetical protein [Myxococcota bacterium]